MKKNLKYFIALNLIENANVNMLNKLINKVDKVEFLFDNNLHLTNLEIAEKNILKKIKQNKAFYLEQADKEIEKINKDKSFQVFSIEDEGYPELLKKIFDPPVVIYVKGKLPDSRGLAVVGTRESSRDGLDLAFQIAKGLVRNGFYVVSGMALGIDSYAHKGAIEGNGQTVAVLGSGLNWIYPPENKNLYYQIAEQGAVISEFCLNQKPEKFNFPRRNRIISGLSLGTIVVEAGNRSGALITAAIAIEQNRDVFAVPGPVNSRMSTGTNRLIKEGAKLVQNINDIIEEYNGFDENAGSLHVNVKTEKKKTTKEELTKQEKKVLDKIDIQPLTVDDIYIKTKIQVSDLESILMLLEIKGYIEQVPGHKFRLNIE